MSGLRAVARLAATEALRSRLVLAVALTVALALVALAWGATGDGTPAGRLRAFLSWGTGWTELVLSLVAVFTATGLAQALRDGRLVPVLAGPLPRGLLPLAWWLGLALVLALLVAGAQALTWGLARAVAWRSPPDAVGGVLACRGVARPLPRDEGGVEAAAQARYAALERAGDLADRSEAQRDDVLRELLEAERERLRTVTQARSLSWWFAGIEPEAGATAVTLRFRYDVRDVRGGGGPGPTGVFELRPPGGAKVAARSRWASGRVHELALPLEVLAGGSELEVVYHNRDERGAVVVFPDDGVALLYPAGAFGGNVARAGLVLLGRLLVLAAVAVTCAALIDGKLAALVALFVLLVGSAQGFLHEALLGFTGYGAASPVLVTALQGVLLLLPDFGATDLAGQLASGERVGEREVLAALGVDGALRAGGLLALAAALFPRRELGAIP